MAAAFAGLDIPEQERKYFEMALQMCTTSHVTMFNENTTCKSVLEGKDFVSTMSEAQFSANQTIIGLKHKNKFYNENFGDFFDRVMTSEGFCMTYNMQDYSALFKEDSGLDADFDNYKSGRNSTWNPLDGYPNEDTDQYPMRIFSGKKNTIVFLLIQNKHDVDEACLGPDQGYKIFWHMPNEIPSFMHRSVILGLSKAKTLIMKATQIRTSDDLLRYDARQRRCYFEGEKQLTFFKSYTKSHCDMECLANYTLDQCGCVKFFMPRNASTPICNLTRLECAEEAWDSWLENDKSYLQNSMPCNCYPSCAQVKYEIVSNIDSDFDTNKTIQAFNDDEEFNRDFPT